LINKKIILTIADKNRVINNIINALISRERFLILGHINPDEDCIASKVAFALLASKFYKETTILLGSNLHEHFQYLLNICKYNSIKLVNLSDAMDINPDTLVICDTPKRDMVESNSAVDRFFSDKRVLKIEIDHHIGGDSEYIGDRGYRLVTEASSAAELIGHITLKLKNQAELLNLYRINNLMSRNLVLSILTGIIGDSQMGQFLKSRKEKRYYQIFSNKFNQLLAAETTKETNFSNMEQIYKELRRHSDLEDRCYSEIMERKQFSRSIGYVALSMDEMQSFYKRYDGDTIVSVTRVAADKLAEESGKMSLVAYYDNPEKSDLVQFRARRSQNYKEFDLRQILKIFSIENGGGHEGAIGFRIPSNKIKNFSGYVNYLIQKVEEEILR